MSARHEYPGTIANQTYHIRFDCMNALLKKKDTWRNLPCSVETNALKNQIGCYRNADFG